MFNQKAYNTIRQAIETLSTDTLEKMLQELPDNVTFSQYHLAIAIQDLIYERKH